MLAEIQYNTDQEYDERLKFYVYSNGDIINLIDEYDKVAPLDIPLEPGN